MLELLLWWWPAFDVASAVSAASAGRGVRVTAFTMRPAVQVAFTMTP